MKITKEILDDFITQRYKKWLADTARLVTKGDTDEAAEIVNDVIEYTYKRIEDKGAFNCKNIDGYIYTGVRLSKTSENSPYQRKRGLQFIYVPLSEIFEELRQPEGDEMELNFN